MAVTGDHETKMRAVLEQEPSVTIFLRPIAPPAALGLAGFAGSTFITSTWIANWWGGPSSPTIFFPFVALFGGLAQFLAGLKGFEARDVLVTVINTMWGVFWMSVGFVYLLTAVGSLPPHPINEHFPELASWFIPLTAFTYIGAIAATARDVILSTLLFSLAIGCTIALSLFAFNPEGVDRGIKAAAYFWIFSSILAWWRVSTYLIEEAYGPRSKIASFFPVFRLPKERSAPLIVPGMGEPGVKRGMPGVI